jgi:cation transport regulator ChaC
MATASQGGVEVVSAVDRLCGRIEARHHFGGLGMKTTNGDRWYFAYGSNLFVDQKVERTGSIRQAIRCRLSGFRLAFNKRGKKGQIYANIVPEDSAEVWGVAYLCNPQAFRKMDIPEGVADGHYEHLPVTVALESGEEVEAITYVAGEDFVCEEGKPESWYLDKIVKGAKYHNLPGDYIAQIETLATQSCP